MVKFVYILFLGLILGCTYNGFDADEWDGGANELLLELSETTISLLNNKETVDTVYVKTNGDSWSFEIDTTIRWCNGVQVDSMLLLFIDSNVKTIPRLAIINISANYNSVSVSKKLSLVQPAMEYFDPTTGLKVPNVDHEVRLELEWSKFTEYQNWKIDDSLKSKIYTKLDIDNLDYDIDFSTAIEERKIMIKGYDLDGTLSKNIINDKTASVGFWFSADGAVTDVENGVLCWDFESDTTSGCIDYSSTIIFLSSFVYNIEAEYNAYYVLSAASGKNFVIKLTLEVHKSLPSITQTVKCYDLNYNVLYKPNFQPDDSQISLNEYMSEIKSLLGGVPNRFYIAWGGVDSDYQWRNGGNCGWWFGGNGGISTPSPGESAMSLEPMVDNSDNFRFVFNDLALNKLPNSLGINVYRVRYYLINSATLKGVELVLNIRAKLDDDILVNSYEVVYDVPFLDWYRNVEEIVNDTIWSTVVAELGANVGAIYMGDSMDDSCGFQLWEINDGWFGEDGLANWGSDEALFHFRFDEEGYMIEACSYGDLDINSLPVQANVILRFVNADVNAILDMLVTLNIHQ